jgi:hypothetical protein
VRKGAVIVLAVLGALLALVAANALWFQRNVVDNATFSRQFVRSLQSEVLSQAVAVEVWGYIRGQYPVLSLMDRKVAETAIAEVLRRPGFEDLLQGMASQAHLAVTGGKGGDVTLDFGEDYPLLLEAVYAVEPDLVAELPPGNQLQPIVVVGAELLPDLSRLTKAVPWVAWFAGVMAALAILLALAVAENRGRALAAVGFCTLVFAAVELVALFLVRPGLSLYLPDPTTVDLVAAAVRVFVQGLRTLVLFVAAAGLGFGVLGMLLGRER